MISQSNFALATELLEQLAEQGLESQPEMIRIMVNEALCLKRQNHLQARPHEWTAG
jgi:hypothetical protein